jgi:hypothetical protein
MKKNTLLIKKILLLFAFLISLSGKGQNSTNELKSEFRTAETKQIYGSSFMKNYEFSHESAPMGDFLSKLWSIFGETKNYGYDGYTYAIEHIPTGIIFSAYIGMSGPSFGGFEKDREALKNVYDKFQQLLKAATYVDCELTFQTDYGQMNVGCKGGLPFDILIEE